MTSIYIRYTPRYRYNIKSEPTNNRSFDLYIYIYDFFYKIPYDNETYFGITLLVSTCFFSPSSVLCNSIHNFSSCAKNVSLIILCKLYIYIYIYIYMHI